MAGPASDIPTAVGWFPDGKDVGYRLFKPGNALGGIGLFEISTGKTRPFATFNEVMTGEFKWLPEGRELLALSHRKDRTISSDLRLDSSQMAVGT